MKNNKDPRPVRFPEANRTLTKPADMKEECGELPVLVDGYSCVSCWRVSFLDRLRLLLRGRIWLGVITGNTKTQPPVWILCRYPFEKQAKGGEE